MKIKGLHIHSNGEEGTLVIEPIQNMKQFIDSDIDPTDPYEVAQYASDEIQFQLDKSNDNYGVHQLISVIEDAKVVKDVCHATNTRRLAGMFSLNDVGSALREYDGYVKRWQDGGKSDEDEAYLLIEEIGKKLSELVIERLDYLNQGSFVNEEEYNLFYRKLAVSAIKQLSDFLLDLP